MIVLLLVAPNNSGYSIGRVARKIADKLIKFYDKETR